MFLPRTPYLLYHRATVGREFARAFHETSPVLTALVAAVGIIAGVVIIQRLRRAGEYDEARRIAVGYYAGQFLYAAYQFVISDTTSRVFVAVIAITIVGSLVVSLQTRP